MRPYDYENQMTVGSYYDEDASEYCTSCGLQLVSYFGDVLEEGTMCLDGYERCKDCFRKVDDEV